MMNGKMWIFGLALILSASAASAAGGAGDRENKKKKTAAAHSVLVAGSGMKTVCLVGADGKIEWEYPAGRGSNDAWLLPNGNVLFAYTQGVKEVTRDKKVVWEYTGPKGTEIHTCQPLPHGVRLVGQSGTPPRLLEMDRAGKVLKKIDLEIDAKKVHVQFRQARKTTAGTYLVACTGDGKIREFGPDGKVLLEVEVPGNPFAVVRLPDGNTLVGCGDGHKLIELDPKGKTVWEIGENDLPGNPLRFVGGVQRLANGNTVVANWGGHGHKGAQPQIFEVTRDKRVVWQLFDNKQFTTLSTVQVLDVPGNVLKGEVLR